MGFNEGARRNINYDYESRSGRFVRKIKSSNIFTLTTATVLSGAAAGQLAQGVVGTLQEMFATSYRFANASTLQHIIDVTVGTSTVMSQVVASQTGDALAYQTTNTDAPFFSAGQFSTVTIASRVASTTGSTLSVYLGGIIHPILGAVETGTKS